MAKSCLPFSFMFSWKEHYRDSWRFWVNLGGKASPFSKESVWIDSCSSLSLQACLVDFEHAPALLCEIHAFVSSLRACAKKKDLSRGTRLHNRIVTRGLVKQCSDALVTMYAKCGQLAKAKELLDIHTSGDVFSWTDLMGGYVRNGQGQDALDCFTRMQEEGPSPNAATFTCILKACGNMRAIDKGQQIHDVISKRQLLEDDIVLGNALVDMYVKCGDLVKAHSVLDKLPVRDVVSWSTLISGYAQQGQCEQALLCYDRMQHEGLCPDAVTLTCILKACATTKECDKGEQIHDDIIRQGLLETDIVLGNALVDMYAKCGSFAKAERELRELPVRDVVSWSALIAGYAEVGQGNKALECFEQMRCEQLSPDPVMYSCILKACGSTRAVDKGEKIHDEIAQLGLLKDNIVLGNALVDMYVKCGALVKARRVLEELPVRDVITWSTLIAGCAQQGQGEQALECFERMQDEGISPNAVTFLCILKACGIIGAIDKAQEIHDEVARQGLLSDNIMLGNAVVDMYAKCDALEKARHVLEELPVQNVVSWNALISGYAEQGQAKQALECFESMQHRGMTPDAVTYLGILKTCGSIGAVDMGEEIHGQIARMGLLSTNIMLGNAVVSMYAKCGALTKAQRALEVLPDQDVISWNALIAGYVEQGQVEEALKCYEWMQEVGISPDLVTFLSILKACASVGASEKGRQIHNEIARQGLLQSSSALSVALVDMYTKSGDLEKAQRVLKELHMHDLVSWNSVIGACVEQGKGEQALKCFDQMQQEGLSPDSLTLAYVLKAYGIVGLLDDAKLCFMSMNEKYGIGPTEEHYTCLIDVLGQTGQLAKALAVIHKTPSFDCCAEHWSTLLNACQKCGDVNAGIWAFEQALKVDRGGIAPYGFKMYKYT